MFRHFRRRKTPPKPFVPVRGKVMEVPVTELLRNLTHAVDMGGLALPDRWEELMKFKTRDVSFWQLCDAIPEVGFTTPICVRVEPNGEWTLGNGHHRMCAAILLCLDTVLVYFSPDEGAMHFDVTDPEDEDVPGKRYADYCDDVQTWRDALWDIERKPATRILEAVMA